MRYEWFNYDTRVIRTRSEDESSVSLVLRTGGNGFARNLKSYNIGEFYNLVDNSSKTRKVILGPRDS